jgi:cytidylate kinase
MNRFMQPRSIAIDGPAGAGKSTVAKRVAERLHLLYVDTGAMYRAVTWYLLQQGVSLQHTDDIVDRMKEVQVSLRSDQGTQKVYVNGEDVTSQIRSPEVTSNVSLVAQIPEVRVKLVEQQRRLAEKQGVVMDGRDIGTYVLPTAAVKIFLTASLRERAKRRQLELQAQGYAISVEEMEQELAKRDRMDTERKFAPLRKADDAYIVDTTGKEIHQVVEEIVALYETSKNEEGGQAAR